MRGDRPEYPPVTEAARKNAERVKALVAVSPRDERIDIDGGISLFWGPHERSAWVLCDNDGEVGFILTKDGVTFRNQDVASYGVTEEEMAAEIKEHVR